MVILRMHICTCTHALARACPCYSCTRPNMLVIRRLLDFGQAWHRRSFGAQWWYFTICRCNQMISDALGQANIWLYICIHFYIYTCISLLIFIVISIYLSMYTFDCMHLHMHANEVIENTSSLDCAYACLRKLHVACATLSTLSSAIRTFTWLDPVILLDVRGAVQMNQFQHQIVVG